MRRKAVYLFCICVGGLLTAGAAKADTIGPTGCGSCFGSSYDLTYSTTANPDVFDIFLTVNTTATTLAAGDVLNAVALKVSSGGPVGYASVISLAEPSGFSPVTFGGINAKGCDGKGSGFFCDPYSTSGGAPIGGAGDIYNFEWQLTLGSGNSLLTGVDAASVKALYLKSDGKNAGITSEGITASLVTPSPIPEPPSLLLLGTGLAFLAGAFKLKLLVA